jgi:hypothetical protein
MRRALWCLLLVSCAARAADMSVGAPGVPPLPAGLVPASVVSSERPKATMAALPHVSGSSIDLRFAPVAQVVDLVYSELLHVPYVIGPDVLQDARPVSFRFDKADGDVKRFLSSFFDSLGYSVTERSGVAFVEKSRLSRDEADRQTFVYRPKYRNAHYLSRIVAPLVRGQLLENRAVSAPEGAKSSNDAPPTSAAGMVDQSTDTLVFVGSSREVAMLKELLRQLDTPVDNVSVRAWVYEVTDAGENKSAFKLALSLLGGRVGASVNVGTALAFGQRDPARCGQFARRLVGVEQ